MICFVKQKVMNYFLRSAFRAPRLKRKGWGIKCLIYAAEGTPGCGGRVERDPDLGPTKLRAVRGLWCWKQVDEPGVQNSPKEKGHRACPLTLGQDGSNERQAPDGQSVHPPTVFSLGSLCKLPVFFPVGFWGRQLDLSEGESTSVLLHSWVS